MATITSVPLEEALVTRQKVPSARTLRTRRLEQDADDVARVVASGSGALITVAAEDLPAARYLSGLRSALQRRGHAGIVLQKRRNQAQIAAWHARPEDEARLAKRRETGARLGRAATQRAAKGRGRPRRRAS